MAVRPVALNAAIACLFIIGSSLFALGSVPGYVNAVGETADSVTYFAGSIFFTSASFAQLLQAQTPAMTEVDADGSTRGCRFDSGRGCHTIATGWRRLRSFLARSFSTSARWPLLHNVYGAAAGPAGLAAGLLRIDAVPCGEPVRHPRVGTLLSFRPRSFPWWIAWLNMIGSIFFMASALASFVLPGSGELVNNPVSVGGTLLGAVCFLLGASLMFPAWRRAVRAATRPLTPEDPQTQRRSQ